MGNQGVHIPESILRGESHFWDANGGSTILDVFKENKKNGVIQSNALALKFHSYDVTFAQLDAVSSHLASILQKELKGIRNANPDGDLAIGTCMDPSPKYICVLFAIWKIGGAFVPFDTAFPDCRIRTICDECKPSLIIVDDNPLYNEKFKCISSLSTSTKILSLAHDFVSSKLENWTNEDAPMVKANVDMSSIFGILYTSGSTGFPKGVRLSHEALLNRLYWQWATFPPVDKESGCWKTTITFVDAIPEILGALLKGKPLGILPKDAVTNPIAFLKAVHQYKVTRVYVVPSFLRAIVESVDYVGLEEGRRLLASVRLWASTGEPLTTKLLQDVQRICPDRCVVGNFYGSTEIFDVCVDGFGDLIESKIVDGVIPIGRPVWNTDLYIVDKNMKPVPLGDTGQIAITGRNLAKGYVGKSQENSSFLANPFSSKIGNDKMYLTGDYGKIVYDKEGRPSVILKGRMVSRVKVRGQRVDLQEIETVIKGMPLVAQVKVLCYKRDEPEQEIIAFTVPANPSVTLEELLMLFRNNLRPSEIPTVELQSSLPLLVNGKTDRRLLLKEYEEKRLTGNRDIKCIDWLDVSHIFTEDKKNAKKVRSVLEVLSKILSVDMRILITKPDSSYFELGGTSLNTITSVVSLTKVGWQITPEDFMRASSLKELIAHIRTVNSSECPDAEDPEFGLWRTEKITRDHREEANTITSECFTKRGDLETLAKVPFEHFKLMMDLAWDYCVEQNCSFIVRRVKNGEMVGVSINFDENDQVDFHYESSALRHTADLPCSMEDRCRELFKLSEEKGKVLNANLVAFDNSRITPLEAVNLGEFIERENIRIAKQQGFTDILTVNTSPLTRDICVGLLGYRVLESYPTNQFVGFDGTRPYAAASDSHRIVCLHLKIHQHMDRFRASIPVLDLNIGFNARKIGFNDHGQRHFTKRYTMVSIHELINIELLD